EFAVYAGTKRDALRHALGANAENGLRLTNDDNRRKVTRALADDEWKTWSDVQLGDLCKVSDRFVAKVRKELGAIPATRTGADGRTIKTAGIGQKTKARAV